MKRDSINVTQIDGKKVKYVYSDTLLPDDLVELYARSVGYEVRTGISKLERPSFTLRQEMIKVP
jgi:hypothetical protein